MDLPERDSARLALGTECPGSHGEAAGRIPSFSDGDMVLFTVFVGGQTDFMKRGGRPPDRLVWILSFDILQDEGE